MPVNLNRPSLWKADTKQSVDLYNQWFMNFAPKTFRATRVAVTKEVEDAIAGSDDFRGLSASVIRDTPSLIRTLRMSCCPPIAVDRLIGLSYTPSSLVKDNLEKGKLPSRMKPDDLAENLTKVCNVIARLLDPDLFPWIPDKREATSDERHRASTVVADRLTGADANPIIRNAQEKRQLDVMAKYLNAKGYSKKPYPQSGDLKKMPAGTYSFHLNVATLDEKGKQTNVSVDVVIQPQVLRADKLPIFVEAKSAGDYTNTNKRRKEEAKKMSQLKSQLGKDVCYVVFLCGYFDSGYLGYEAAEGIDWVWEHRISDFDLLGL